MNCLACEREIPEDARLCPYCGMVVGIRPSKRARLRSLVKLYDKAADSKWGVPIAIGFLFISVVFTSCVLFLIFLFPGIDTGPARRRVSEATDTPAVTPTEKASPGAPKPTRTPEPTGVPEQEALYLGDVTQTEDYLLSALTVEDPTTPDTLYEATPGTKLVAVEIVVGNISNETLSVNPLNATLVDGDGFVYEVELGGRAEGQQIATVDLGYGEKVRGWVAFEVPENAVPANVKYEIEAFDDVVLKARLAQPPEGHTPNTGALSITPPPLPTKLGETAEQHNYSLSATAVEDPATPTSLYTPVPGYKLVAVEIVVGNVSGETLSVNPVDVLLVDDAGFVYTPELTAREDQLALIDLGTGEKIKGWIAFTILEGATPTSVKYGLGPFAGEPFLQTGLAE